MSAALASVVRALREEGGLIAAATVDPSGPGLPVQGPRAAALEAIREGHLLHHGEPRLLATDDADLALLAGDRLYALGLAQLADLGDLEAVRVMAEVIATAAAALGDGDATAAEVAWEQGIRALRG